MADTIREQTGFSPLEWDPFKGTRIGEASNPGPGGLRRTQRVWEETRQSQQRKESWDPWAATRVGEAKHPGPADGEEALAQALLSVLANYAPKPPEVTLPKGKGRQTPPMDPQMGEKRGRTSLASRLHAVPKAAIEYEWDDCKVASRIASKIKGWQEECTSDPPPAKKVRWADMLVDPEPQKTPELNPASEKGNAGKGPPQEKGKGKPDSKGKGKAKGPGPVKLDPPQPDPTPTWFSSKGKGKGKGKGASAQGESPPQFASKVCSEEWDCEARLTTPYAVKKAVEAGESLPGNLIVAKQLGTVLQELQDLWAAYDVDEPMTVAASCSQGVMAPAVAVAWKGNKAPNHRMDRIKLQTWQLSPMSGPETKAPTTVFIRPQNPKSVVTLRISAPFAYRKFHRSTDLVDSPQVIISDLAKALPCQVSFLTGGNWEQAQLRSGSLTVGHVRVQKELADRLLALSGRQGIFLTVLDKEAPRSNVAWLPKSKDCSPEEHFRVALELAESRKLPLCFRQGGGSDLGLLGADPSEFSPADRVSVWTMHGVPPAFDQDDVLAFLKDQKWKEATIVTRKKGRRKQDGPIWFVRAAPPERRTSQEPFTYADDDTFITIALEGSRPKPAPQVTKLKAPRKNWRHSNEVAPTQLDLPSSPRTGAVKRHVINQELRDAEGDTEMPTEHPTSAEDRFVKDRPGWSIQDLGGTGDCAFRCVAAGIASAQGKALTSEQVTLEASRLRLLAVGYLNKHHVQFAPLFVVDSEDKPEWWGGESTPQTFEAYTAMLAKRQVWADGMALQALAERLGRPLIVWRWRQSGPQDKHPCWQRCVLAPWIEEGIAQSAKKADPVVLLLRDNHYKLATSSQPCPQAWLYATDPKPSQELRGGGSCKEGRGCKCSGGLSLPSATPPRRRQGNSIASTSTCAVHAAAVRSSCSKPSGRAPCLFSLPGDTPGKGCRGEGLGSGDREGRGSSQTASLSAALPRGPGGTRVCSSTPAGPTPHKKGFDHSLPPISKKEPQGKDVKRKACILSLPSATPPKRLKNVGGSKQIQPQSANSVPHMRSDSSIAPAEGIFLPSATPRGRRDESRNPKRKAPELSLPQSTPQKRAKTKGSSASFSLEAPLSTLAGSSGPSFQKMKGSQNGNGPLKGCLIGPQKGTCKPRNKPGTKNRAPEGAVAQQLGRILWWECEHCPYKLYRHPHRKPPSSHRKRHLNSVHGVALKDIPSLPKTPCASPRNGKADYQKALWKDLWSSFTKAKWPRAHKVSEEPNADSPAGTPLFTCRKCRKKLRRADLATSLCPQSPSNPRGPSLQARQKKWKVWLTKAKQRATDKCASDKLVRQQKTGCAAAIETSKLRKQSGAVVLPQKPNDLVCGLPAFPAQNTGSKVWWSCPFPGCGFQVKTDDPSQSYKRKTHLQKTHGPEAYAPLPKGHKQALALRAPSARRTFDLRWSKVYAAYKASKWQGTHDIVEEPCEFRQYWHANGTPYTRPQHRCNTCGNMVPRTEVPREACPAKLTLVKPNLATRKKQWAEWSKEAKATCGKNAAKRARLAAAKKAKEKQEKRSL